MDAAGSFRKELFENAHALVRPGFGILAADESTGTIGGKFEKVGIENTEENRRRYRTLLFTTPNLHEHISGVILFDETTKQNSNEGTNLVELLKSRGIFAGIKVDKGLQEIPGTNGERATVGLADLAARAKEYYSRGIRFAKWRAVIKITKELPSELAIKEISWGLARYAAICQANGLVPIVEPEVLADGDHDIHRCAEVSQKVFASVVSALHAQKIYWEGALLKPNMITPGLDYPNRKDVTPQETAALTVRTLLRTIPAALPGIVLLSGGQSEEEASVNLSEINKSDKKPWSVTFSYGRALQNTCVKTWGAKEENFKAAQEALLVRARANSQASVGKYVSSGNAAANESLVIKNYVY